MSTNLPGPARFHAGICVNWLIFDNEADAVAWGEHIRRRGDTYNGGMYHGRPCGDVDRRGDEWWVSVA
jgi:hypothetical protein